MAAWLDAQQQFWRRFPQSPDGDAAVDFWAHALSRWWQQVNASLPPPLAKRVDAALAQSRVYLGVALGAQHAEAATSDGIQQFLDALVDMWCAHRAQPDMSDAQKRYTLAYSRFMVMLSDIAQQGLQRACNDCPPNASTDPSTWLQSLYDAMDDEYRVRATSDEFIALIGELVNARVEMLAHAACESPP